MSLLMNNERALETLQSYNKEELEKLFGIQEKVAGKIVVALYNSDIDRKKEVLYQCNPAGIVTGIKVLQILTEAEGIVIVSKADLSKVIETADKVCLCVEVIRDEFVNKTLYEKAKFYSPDELVEIAERLNGNKYGKLVSVGDAPLEEIPDTTLINEYLESKFPDYESTVKGIITDHNFYNILNLEHKTIGTLNLKSGVLHVLTEKQCVVNYAENELLKLRRKSCGRCTFCREGLIQITEIIHMITKGNCPDEKINLAKEIGEAMKISCNCTLGDDAANPVISMLDEFGQELDAHVKRKECPSEVCKALIHYYIDPKNCTGCGSCISICEKGCIEGKQGYTSVIDEFDCSRCGKCLDICKHGAVRKVTGKIPKVSDKPMRIKGVEIAEESVSAVDKVEKPRGGKRKRVYAKAK